LRESARSRQWSRSARSFSNEIPKDRRLVGSFWRAPSATESPSPAATFSTRSSDTRSRPGSPRASIRTCFATRYQSTSIQTTNIRLTQKAHRHANPATTQIYTRIVAEELEGALRSFRRQQPDRSSIRLLFTSRRRPGILAVKCR